MRHVAPMTEKQILVGVRASLGCVDAQGTEALQHIERRGGQIDVRPLIRTAPDKPRIKTLGHLFADLEMRRRDARPNRRDKRHTRSAKRFDRSFNNPRHQSAPARVNRSDRAAVTRRQQNRHAIGRNDPRELLGAAQHNRVGIARRR